MISGAELIDRLEADPLDETLLEEIEAEAVGWVEMQTGRYFGPEKTEDVVLVGSGTNRLWLPEAPKATITSIIERAFLGADETTILATDDNGFELRLKGTEAFLVRKGAINLAQYGTPASNVWIRPYEYKLPSYRQGYDPGTEPVDIRNAVIGVTGAFYAARSMGGGIIRSETEGRVSRTLSPQEIRDAVPGLRQTLLAWRRHGT